MKKNKFYNNFNIILISYFFFSIFLNYYQAKFNYDAFHNGLISTSAINFLSGDLLAYKDFFIHYGFVNNLINSITLYITDNKILCLNIINAVFFSLGNILLIKIIQKNFGNFYALISLLIVISVHPLVNYNYYNYQSFFFLVLGIYIYENNKNFFLSGIFFSLSTLVYDNLFFIWLIFIFPYFLIFLIVNKKDKQKFIIGSLIPIFLFHLYLYTNNLHEFWIKNFFLNKVFLEIYNINFVELIYNFIIIFLSKASLVGSNFGYTFYLLIILCNFCFLIHIFYTNSFKENRLLVFISVLSLLLVSSALHKITIYRFSTGLIIGLITIIYFIKNYCLKNGNSYLLIMILGLMSSTFIPSKNEGNLFFPKFYHFEDNIYNNDIKYFKGFKWSEKTWNNLNYVKDVSSNVNLKCKDSIKNYINFTNDGFYSLILNDYFENIQFLPWYQDNIYYNRLMKIYNPNFEEKLSYNLSKKRTLIIIDKYEISNFLKKYNFYDYNLYEIPYSYFHRNNFIILPKTCKFN